MWIDALSINQRNKMERAKQVQEMRQIFQSASGVVVSLGDEVSDSLMAFKYLNKYPSRVSFNPSNTPWATAAKAEVQALLSHSWWKRVWVIQEIAVVKKIDIWRGPYSVSWDRFCRFVIQEQIQPRGSNAFARALYKFLEYGLLDLSHEFRSREATNPRDKLYALLGPMANAADRGVVPDYSKPVREVYMCFVRSHISQYQSLVNLSFAEYWGNHYLSLPTWCANWTVQALNPSPLWQKTQRDFNMWLHETQDYFHAAGSSKASLVHHREPDVLATLTQIS
jgi:hypothetical protein